ncbi:IS3 family transposase, partial [Gallicola sp. Sow4_E12]
KTSKQSKNTKDNKTKRELELEEENKHLRIENAFLKELRRLRLAEARKKNESQESSIISEDPSN